jgi:hypothetical protein
VFAEVDGTVCAGVVPDAVASVAQAAIKAAYNKAFM